MQSLAAGAIAGGCGCAFLVCDRGGLSGSVDIAIGVLHLAAVWVASVIATREIMQVNVDDLPAGRHGG